MPFINWNLLGPVLGAVVFILMIIFAFIIKMRKMDKTPNSPPPKNPANLDKKSLCFKHEGDISSNATAIGMIGKQLEKQEKQNIDDHNRIYDKMEDSETKILKAIKNNG